MNQQSHESLRLHCSKTLELSDLCHLTRFADVRTGVGLLWIKTSSQGSPKIDKSFGDIWDIFEVLNSPYFKAPTFWTLHPDLSVHGRPSGFGSTKKKLASQIREAQRETDQLGCVSNVKWLRMAVKTVFFPRFFPHFDSCVGASSPGALSLRKQPTVRCPSFWSNHVQWPTFWTWFSSENRVPHECPHLMAIGKNYDQPVDLSHFQIQSRNKFCPFRWGSSSKLCSRHLWVTGWKALLLAIRGSPGKLRYCGGKANEMGGMI